MASYRRPKGTVVRPIPDWNSKDLYYGGIQNSSLGGLDYFDGVQNLETDGSSLIIWDCTISLGAFTAGTQVIGSADWFLAQVPQHAFPGQLAPLDPIGPTILSVVNHGFDTSNLVTGMPFYTVLSGPDTWRWPNPWPMAIIRPGFTWLVNFIYNNATAGFGVIVEKAFYP
jgi:hypothetical protein